MEDLHVYGKYFINSMENWIVANQDVKSEKSETKILETLFINDPSVHFCWKIAEATACYFQGNSWKLGASIIWVIGK